MLPVTSSVSKVVDVSWSRVCSGCDGAEEHLPPAPPTSSVVSVATFFYVMYRGICAFLYVTISLLRSVYL